MPDERQPDVKISGRGFKQYDKITDERGVSIRVQESSAAWGDYMWLFCQFEDGNDYNQPPTYPNEPRESSDHRLTIPDPHLSFEQVVCLRDALDLWIQEHPQDG